MNTDTFVTLRQPGAFWKSAHENVEHTDQDTVGIKFPAKVKRVIGFDDTPSWIIFSEYNVDEWPNGGLSPIPGPCECFQLRLHPTRLVCAGEGGIMDPSGQRWSTGVRR